MNTLEARALKHQITGAKQLAKVRRGILADDMGLGKTFTSVLWAEYLKVNRILVTAPKEVTSNLREEIGKWTDKPIIDFRGLNKMRRDVLLSMLSALDSYIILVNLEAWSRDKELLSGLIDLKIQAIIADEAHHLSNTRTSAFKGVRELTYAVNQCPGCTASLSPLYRCNRSDCDQMKTLNRFKYCMGCGHQQFLVSMPDCTECNYEIRSNQAEARSVMGILLMTGTLVINDPKDAWPICFLVNQKKFPSIKSYTDYFLAVDGTRGKHVFRESGREDLLRQLGKSYVARTRRDAGISLPPQTIEVLEYDRDWENYGQQWRAYESLERSFVLELETEEMPITDIVVQLMRMRQMLIWPQGIEFKDERGKVTGRVEIAKSQKMDIVHGKILEYVERGHRVAAFSNFTGPLRELKRRLGSQAVVYDGNTPDQLRSEIRADFAVADNINPRWAVILGNYRSVGESTTLVGADQTVILDPQWSPSKDRQAYGRTNRIGQNKHTRVHIPRFPETVDTWMAGISEFKTQHEIRTELLKAIKEGK